VDVLEDMEVSKRGGFGVEDFMPSLSREEADDDNRLCFAVRPLGLWPLGAWPGVGLMRS
jgi:hypothetical protein